MKLGGIKKYKSTFEKFLFACQKQLNGCAYEQEIHMLMKIQDSLVGKAKSPYEHLGPHPGEF